jgi:Transposase IS66 family
VNYIDETTWYQHGVLAWLWVMVNTTVALFKVQASRNKVAFEALVEPWAGILVRDGYGVYRQWMYGRQACLTHLIRRARGLSERHDPEVAWFGRWVITELQRLVHWATAPLTSGEVQMWYARVVYLLARYEQRRDEAGTLARTLNRELGSLWTFIVAEGVEPTNNRAERSIRFAVLWRKIMQGTYNEKGDRWVEQILSVRETSRLRGRATYPVLVEAVTCYFNDHHEEINASFDRLQQELSQQIDEAMPRTRQQLLENFDAEVIEKLCISRDSSTAYLDHYERMLMELTHHELRVHIKVLDGLSSFRLTSCPFGDGIPLGVYELPRRSGEAYLYRLSHPLAQHVLSQAKGRALPPAEVTFDDTNHLPIISILKPLVGQEGSLRLSLITIESLDQVEDYLIVAALADKGQSLDVEQATRLLRLPARDCRHLKTSLLSEPLASITRCRQEAILQSVSQRNAGFFEAEANKLDGWAEDLKAGLEREIKELDRQIREARRADTAAPTLQEKLEAQKYVKSLEAHRNTRRRALFDVQDEIDRHRE